MSEKAKPVDCFHCKYFDGDDCTIIVETDDFEKCLKPTEDGLGYEFCPLYGGYPKEEQA